MLPATGGGWLCCTCGFFIEARIVAEHQAQGSNLVRMTEPTRADGRNIRLLPVVLQKHQHDFVLSHVPSMLMESDGGGGKTASLVLAAARDVDVPGYSAVICVANSEFAGHVHTQMLKWYPMLRGHRTLPNRNRWKFPSGASIQVLVGHPSPHINVVFDFVGVDHAERFSRTDIERAITLLGDVRRHDGTTRVKRFRVARLPSHDERMFHRVAAPSGSNKLTGKDYLLRLGLEMCERNLASRTRVFDGPT
ncbi:hypothetical protein EKK58_05395 [Candidatus Dependentiae bacterium]|nr:MAG: hypothetical protein EKK58_05395 [Candidatus Dependentiae bacterium]